MTCTDHQVRHLAVIMIITFSFHYQESLLIDCASLTNTAPVTTADDNGAQQYNSHACRLSHLARDEQRPRTLITASYDRTWKFEAVPYVVLQILQGVGSND